MMYLCQIRMTGGIDSLSLIFGRFESVELVTGNSKITTTI